VHLRTTNPIESTFATVRHRSKITKGPGSRAAGLAMAFKLIASAQDRWRAVNAPHLVALVRAGATFINGKLVERPGEDPSPKPPKDLDPQVLTIALGIAGSLSDTEEVTSSAEPTKNLSQLSHGRTGRCRTLASMPDCGRTLTCRYGFQRTDRTCPIDLRVRRFPFAVAHVAALRVTLDEQPSGTSGSPVNS